MALFYTFEISIIMPQLSEANEVDAVGVALIFLVFDFEKSIGCDVR
jgi:hypothetical protein